MARYVKNGDGRPGGGNGKNKEAWGKGATDGSNEGDHLQGLHDTPDTIDGMGGDDNINGFSGDDVLIGGDGADDITPGQGEDIVDLRVVVDDHGTPDDPSDDTYDGDGHNDTVNIGVYDDPHVYNGETFENDPYDTILGYEVAEEGTDAEENTFTTRDVIDLDDMGGSLDALVEGGNTGGTQAEGEVIDQITAAELQNVLWVTEDGKLVFDADGNGDGDKTDDDVLAMIMMPNEDPAVDGVTVRFEAEIEVVDEVDDNGFVTGTSVDTAEYVAVWDQENSGWSISIDGGDWIA